MKILVLNCGSSSLKYQLIDVDTRTVMTKGLLERIGLPSGIFSYTSKGEKHTKECPIPNHTEGLRLVMEALTDPVTGVIKSIKEVGAVGHRFAHGGEYFTKSVQITRDVINKEESLIDLAPLHIPGNIMGAEAINNVMPDVPQVAFHGTSHRFVAKRGAKMIGKYWKDLKLITCHLGSGASICAIDHGKSVNNSMGMTSLEGLTMGSRCGDIDVGAVLYLMDKAHISPQEINDILYKKSGLTGLTGASPDMRDIWAGVQRGDKRNTLAFEVFAQRCKKYIGAFMAQMNGCDLLIFTGGIGENAWFMRHAILENMDWLGVEVDMELNDRTAGVDAVISKPGARVTTAVVLTDEELAIAVDTYKIVTGQL